jgi:hypothetical protein
MSQMGMILSQMSHSKNEHMYCAHIYIFKLFRLPIFLLDLKHHKTCNYF